MTISITYYNYEGFVSIGNILYLCAKSRLMVEGFIYKNRDSHHSGVADPSEYWQDPQRSLHHLSMSNSRCIQFRAVIFSQVATREIACRTKTIPSIFS